MNQAFVKRVSWLLVAGVVTVVSCSEDEESSGSGRLVINSTEYRLDQMMVRPVDFGDRGSWIFMVANDQAKVRSNELLTGSKVNMMSFVILGESVDDALPAGTFNFEPGGLFETTWINLNQTLGQPASETSYYEASEGQLEILQDGPQYTLSFTGTLNDQPVICTYTGKLRVLDVLSAAPLR